MTDRRLARRPPEMTNPRAGRRGLQAEPNA
jgi:hypothetical protein